MDFKVTDIPNPNQGRSTFSSIGFLPTVSLDVNPFKIKRLFETYGIKPATVCAHGALLGSSNPGLLETAEIMKAAKPAAAFGIKEVITKKNTPSSGWGENFPMAGGSFPLQKNSLSLSRWQRTLACGSDPVEMANVYKDKIGHIHWKDLGKEWIEKRGTIRLRFFDDRHG